MSSHRQSKWAAAILAAQHADGTWGSMFHSMAQPASAPLTTEQALRRLHALGFTRDDEPIRRCVDTMAACRGASARSTLTGKRASTGPCTSR